MDSRFFVKSKLPLPTYSHKLVLLGDAAVGKSSLALRFVKGSFYDYQESTIGAAFLTKNITLKDQTVKFELWDTAGQERYHSLAPMYYRSAAAAIVVYDITSRQSFQRAKAWVKELQNQATTKTILIALVGNKIDLKDNRQVQSDEAKTYADENGLLCFESSAKSDVNISEIFKEIANKIPKPTQKSSDTVNFIDMIEEKEPSKGCCK